MRPFSEFVQFFPPVIMPVTLGEDTHHTFSNENEPLPDDLIAAWIQPLEGEVIEEEVPFTEYVPCFSIDSGEPYVALVWWKATSQQYQYTLATFTPQGQLIQQIVIGHVSWQGPHLTRTVATIGEDLSIILATGSAKGLGDDLDKETVQIRHMDMHPDGTIG